MESDCQGFSRPYPKVDVVLTYFPPLTEQEIENDVGTGGKNHVQDLESPSKMRYHLLMSFSLKGRWMDLHFPIHQTPSAGDVSLLPCRLDSISELADSF